MLSVLQIVPCQLDECSSFVDELYSFILFDLKFRVRVLAIR